MQDCQTWLVEFLKCTYRLELRLDLSSAPAINGLFSLLTDGDSGVHCWRKAHNLFHKTETGAREECPFIWFYLRSAVWGSALFPRDNNLPGRTPPLSLLPQLLLQIKSGNKVKHLTTDSATDHSSSLDSAQVRFYLCFLSCSVSAWRLSILSPKSCLKSRLASNARSLSLSACLHLVLGAGCVNINER